MQTQKAQVDEIYKKWNDDLYQRYIQLFPEEKHTTIWDGVVDPASYACAPLKVMFLNKEAYGEEGNCYDVSKALFSIINEGQRIFPNQTNLRTHFKQYLCVLQSIESSSFSNISDEEMRAQVAKQITNEEWFNTRMSQTAYCNVKKSDGQSKSNTNDLYNYAKKGLDILKEQIRFFNPSIILAGNVCDGILDDLVEWGENLYIAEDRSICIWQIKIDGNCYPFVDMYHPSNVQGMSEYYLNLLHALQDVEERIPGFWENKVGLPCFNMNENSKVQTHLQPNNKAEEWFNKGKAAAKNKDWKTAIQCYNEATTFDYAPAYREMGLFFENVYSGNEVLYLDDFFDQFDKSYTTGFVLPEEYYYAKAAEYGDKESQLKFVKTHISDIAKFNKILNTAFNIVRYPFSARKKLHKTNEYAELAVIYMNKLVKEQYEPALELLESWKQQANDESNDFHYTAKEILEHIQY